MKNWQTTLFGVGGILAAVGTALQAQFDGDPATSPNWPVVASLILLGIGNIFAKDAKAQP
jgi:hypothetical protein